MLQNGKVVARFVCVLVRRAGLALCVVSSCARCGVFARCRVGVPASSWAGPQIGIYSLGAPIHYLSANYVVNFTARPTSPSGQSASFSDAKNVLHFCDPVFLCFALSPSRFFLF